MAVSVGPKEEVERERGGSERGESERGGSDHAELNLRILQSLALWLAETKGTEALRRVAAAGDVRPEDLSGRSVWVSWPRFERILAAAAEHTTGEEELRNACAHRITESYGALRLLLKASTPEMVFRQAAKSFPTISAISETEVEVRSRTRLRFVYRSKRSESRHMCLSRQGQAVFLPTLWGLPRATLEEKRCIAWGDDACEYDIRWHASRRWLPIIGAALAGGLVWAGAALAGLEDASWIGSFAVVSFGLFMYALEQHKANAENIAFAQDAQAALGKLAADEEEIRRELVALQGRQRDWLRRVEQELEARTHELHEMEARVEGLHEKRVRVMRGQVHDLRNMLTVIAYALEFMEEERVSDLGRAAVQDGQLSLVHIDRILRQTMQESEPGRILVALEPRRVDIEPLSETLRRRLKALTHGTELRVSVLPTREAPKSIVTDLLLMDRVLDNLLGNAAKYTRRGSIVVEVGGTPGFLTVKISDTGPGIASERIVRVFRPGGASPDERVNGFGVGLSVVVQLLAQIGGRLEVMSKPGEGTTFWVHIPIELDEGEKSEPRSVDVEEGVEQLIRRVVRIRPVN